MSADKPDSTENTAISKNSAISEDEAARALFGIEPATEEELAAARASGLLAHEGDEEEGALRDEDEALDDFLGKHVPASGEWREMG